MCVIGLQVRIPHKDVNDFRRLGNTALAYWYLLCGSPAPPS